MRPPGKEIRPGVWVEPGAQIHRRARIIAPAYIGRGAEVREDTLITRSSNLESSCYIDYGTVIEDSSILTNSYIGIWLDVSRAVVKGNKLANVGRNVVLNISDPNVIRENMAIAKESTRHSTMPASGRLLCASLD
jgi:NDP-sugar pyrophosphorylase family protein